MDYKKIIKTIDIKKITNGIIIPKILPIGIHINIRSFFNRSTLDQLLGVINDSIIFVKNAIEAILKVIIAPIKLIWNISTFLWDWFLNPLFKIIKRLSKTILKCLQLVKKVTSRLTKFGFNIFKRITFFLIKHTYIMCKTIAKNIINIFNIFKQFITWLVKALKKAAKILRDIYIRMRILHMRLKNTDMRKIVKKAKNISRNAIKKTTDEMTKAKNIVNDTISKSKSTMNNAFDFLKDAFKFAKESKSDFVRNIFKYLTSMGRGIITVGSGLGNIIKTIAADLFTWKTVSNIFNVGIKNFGNIVKIAKFGLKALFKYGIGILAGVGTSVTGPGALLFSLLATWGAGTMLGLGFNIMTGHLTWRDIINEIVENIPGLDILFIINDILLHSSAVTNFKNFLINTLITVVKDSVENLDKNLLSKSSKKISAIAVVAEDVDLSRWNIEYLPDNANYYLYKDRKKNLNSLITILDEFAFDPTTELTFLAMLNHNFDIITRMFDQRNILIMGLTN